MYSPLDSSSANSLGNKRTTASRLWSNLGRSATGFAGKPNGRRRGGSSIINYLCHLPLLILWTLIVIIILHKLTSSTSSDTLTEIQQSDGPPEDFNGQYSEKLQDSTTSSDNGGQQESDGQFTFNREAKTTPFEQKQQAIVVDDLSIITSSIGKNNNDRQQQDASSKPIPRIDIIHQKRTTTRPLLSATKKSITSDFARQSRVFILIVQDESFYQRMSLKRDTSRQSATQSNNAHAKHKSDNGNNRGHIRIPNHIRLLISILDSHRIGYEIDTTQFGLPTQLLADRESKLFSVIIIDNFFKYTKLNRWVRDQLDRHCRLNEVGVITYLRNADDLLDSNDSHSYFKTRNQHNHLLSQRSIHSSSSSTAKTITDEFPLIIKPIKQNCHNLSSVDTCLIDYQVSDTTPILRILKRKKEFILPGELDPNQSPWTSMSSNHITYEPITWAKFRKPLAAAARTRRQINFPLHNVTRNLINRIQAKSNDSGTQTNDHADRYRRVEKIESALNGGGNINQTGTRIATLLELHRLETTTKRDDELLHNSDYLSSSSSAEAPRLLSSDDDSIDEKQLASDGDRQILSMLDTGLYDGIKRVIFGFSNEHWLNRVLLLDAIEHLSLGKIISPLDRFIQIDIDDMFVGEKGIRLTRSDVQNLLESQEKFSHMIDGGFKFNLGFSGKYFKHGYDEENLGDEALVANAREFTWFCHFWSHSKAHLFSDYEGIADELRKNLEFARAKHLPLIGQSKEWFNSSGRKLEPTYAVAPHHSGVYPIHEQLYDAWTDILNVRVTSTEEYPHLRPASGRRAFVHKTITVLPRQTCGLYTHTIYKNKYPGGFNKLLANIRGGELFQTILHNPVNIYMTHMSNYAHDRLAPFTFSDLFNFVQENTNLQLKFWPTESSESIDSSNANAQYDLRDLGGETVTRSSLGPENLARYYFGLYPQEREPLWTNPCDDKRHLAIWSRFKQKNYCPSVPKLLIVGPQKTGTTALYSFLKINPVFRSSPIESSGDFEEIQFFNDKHYIKGVDWYFEKFQERPSATITGLSTTTATDELLKNGSSSSANTIDNNNQVAEESIFFDKSATYFDDPKVARRASSLVPDARVIIILMNPIDRAYSWYQHMRAHEDEIANLLSFEQLMMMTTNLDVNNTTTTTTTTLFGGKMDYNSGLHLNASQLHRAIALRNRCLQPGYYAKHLINWLDYFPSRQIIIIDGEWFKYNPAAVLNRLQLLLHVPSRMRIDYNERLVFVKEKGFYCERIPGNRKSRNAGNDHSNHQAAVSTNRWMHKCLGAGKGRRYPPMGHKVRSYLKAHYRSSNRQLARLLSDIGQPLPDWLHADDGVNHLI